MKKLLSKQILLAQHPASSLHSVYSYSRAMECNLCSLQLYLLSSLPVHYHHLSSFHSGSTSASFPPKLSLSLFCKYIILTKTYLCQATIEVHYLFRRLFICL